MPDSFSPANAGAWDAVHQHAIAALPYDKSTPPGQQMPRTAVRKAHEHLALAATGKPEDRSLNLKKANEYLMHASDAGGENDPALAPHIKSGEDAYNAHMQQKIDEAGKGSEPMKTNKNGVPFGKFDDSTAGNWAATHQQAEAALSGMKGWTADTLQTAHQRLAEAAITKDPAERKQKLATAAAYIKGAAKYMDKKPELKAHYDSAKAGLAAQVKHQHDLSAAKIADSFKGAGNQPKTSVGASIHTVANLPEKVAASDSGHHAAVSAAFNAIDALHGAPPHVKPIKILYKGGATTKVAKAAGLFYHSAPGAPHGLITVKPDIGAHAAMTAAHEMGHFIDRRWIAPNQAGFGSKGHGNDPHMKAVMDAIAASKATAGLKALQGKTKAPIQLGDGSTATVPVKGKHVDYLLSPHEQFARAYAQHIANHSQNPGMQAALNRSRDQKTNGIFHHQQWQDDDFKPIGDAMDRMMEAKGWKTKSK